MPLGQNQLDAPHSVQYHRSRERSARMNTSKRSNRVIVYIVVVVVAVGRLRDGSGDVMRRSRPALLSGTLCSLGGMRC